jgi:hypothetical protein
MVAGVVAAASNNGLGVAGVSWASAIMPLRVTNTSGQASSRAIAAGLIWAVNRGATVMNVSFAPLGSDRTVLRAARFARSAGGSVFISAGNDGALSPADANPNTIFVGATDLSNGLASFSTTGSFVDLVAPGVRIRTTAPDNAYQTVSGTSFSSPVAAGVAALVWSVRPELRPATVERILAETATDLGPAGKDDSFGAGLIDAAAAVQQAPGTIEVDDAIAPTVKITEPNDGESVSGVINVTATASDDHGIADVVLSIDGRPFATDTAEPYKFAVNTTKATPGVHTLTCTASDEAGNPSTPVSVQIVVGEESLGSTDGPADTIDPRVVINFPVDGTSVVGSVGIQATARDNAGLARAEWFVDGAAKQTTSISGTRAVVNFVWDAASYSNGSHTIAVRVTDAAHNRAVAAIALIKE